MTNEMKLITALCNALGFDVETVCVNQERVDKSLNEIRSIKFYNPTHGIPVVIPVLPVYEYKLTKSVDSKANYSGIPKKFIDDNLKKAKGSTMFDVPLEDLTKEELMCCVVASWDDEKKTRAAAINKNRLDLSRFLWGRES